MALDNAGKRSRNIMVGCAVLIALAVVFISMVSLVPYFIGNGDGLTAIGREKIAVVEVFGPIVDPAKTVRLIKKYAKDKSIKGIIVHIDSPGGGVAASQEIFNQLVKARKQKPVVASMGSLAASGGYYIAMGSNRVISNPGTITGSIGVIIGFADMRELFSKIGIKPITITSGKFKDIGGPSREFTKEDRQVIQSVVDDVYEQFVDVVATERRMPVEDVTKLADGRIYSGRQALELGMVDELGTFDDSVKILSKMAKIKGEPTIVRDKDELSFLKELLSGKLSFLDSLENAATLKPGLHYLWLGY